MSTAVRTVGPLLLSVFLVMMKPSTFRKWRVLLIMGCCVTESSAPAQLVLLLVQHHFLLSKMSIAILTVGPWLLSVFLVVMNPSIVRKWRVLLIVGCCVRVMGLSIVLKWKMPTPVFRVCLLRLGSVVRQWRPVVLVLQPLHKACDQTWLRLHAQLKAPSQ